MAVVYKAQDVILGRTVALKMLHDRYADELAFQQRFKREARAMASLDHPYIVKVYDISREGQVPFIVAECVEGQDLGEIIAERRRLSESYTREVVSQLLTALSYAHERGIIHRDIKPSNILVTGDGTVKVADFGIARIVADEDSGEEGDIIGSARYMSPEQLTGQEVTPRSDIYSVGILLYHCLTGEPPFSGTTKSVARQQLGRQPTPPRRWNKKIPPGMEKVILKSLAKDPEDRYASADAMLKDLQESAGRGKAALHRRGWRERRKLIAVPVLALLLSGGIAAAALGYDDLTGSNQTSSAAEEVEPAPQQETPQPAPPEEPAAQPENAGPPAEQARPEPGRAPVADNPGASPDDEEPARVGPVPANYVQVPDLDTYFDYSAREVLQNDGFKVKVVYKYREGYADRGVTWSTKPAAGTRVPPGSTVTVYATPKDRYQPKL